MRILLLGLFNLLFLHLTAQSRQVVSDPESVSGKSQNWVSIDFYIYVEQGGQFISDQMIIVDDQAINFSLNQVNDWRTIRRLSYTGSQGRYVQLGFMAKAGDTLHCGTFDGNGQLISKQFVASTNASVWQDTLVLSNAADSCDALLFKDVDPWANTVKFESYSLHALSASQLDSTRWVYAGDTAFGSTVNYAIAAGAANIEFRNGPYCNAFLQNYNLNLSGSSSPRLEVTLSYAGQPLEGMIVFLYKSHASMTRNGGYGPYLNFDHYQYTNANGKAIFMLTNLQAGDSIFWRTVDCSNTDLKGGAFLLGSGSNVSVTLSDTMHLSCLASTCKAAHRIKEENVGLIYRAMPLWNPSLGLAPGNYIYEWVVNGQTYNGSIGAIPLNNLGGNLPLVYDFRLTDSCSSNRATIHYDGRNGPVNCDASLLIDTNASAQSNRTLFVYNNSSAINGGTINYYWDFGDGTTGTGSFPTHTYSGNGPYQLCLSISAIDSSGLDTCYDQTCLSVAFDSSGNFIHKSGQQGFLLNVLDPASVGLPDSDLKLRNAQIYPNPAQGSRTQIVWEGEASARMEVVNTQGAKVLSRKAINSGFQIPKLESGLYFVQLQWPDDQVVLRFLVP